MASRGNFHFLVYFFFAFFVILHGLAAYSLFGVPIPWLAQMGFVVLFLWIFSHDRVYLMPGTSIFLVFFTWALAVTVVSSAMVDYSELMALRATTSYPIYISLRFLSLLVFATTAGIVYWLCQNGYREKVISILSTIGVLVSLYAIYIYIAQTYGLPEPTRNRIGTSGSIQKTTFTYAFHRALGSFREPSHLAQWLVLPMLLSYIGKNKIFNIRGFIIGTAILLSGSLTGILGILAGLAFATLTLNGFEFKKIGRVISFAVPFIFAWLVFSLIATGNSDKDFDLLSVIIDRVEPIIEDGASSSNRSYIYEYLAKQDIPIFGAGLGNANIKFGYDIGSPATASLLNLFITMGLSTGIIGLILCIVFLAYPLFIHFFRNRGRNESECLYIIAAYIAWIAMFMMHAEELTMFFGVTYGLLVFYMKEWPLKVKF